MTFFLSQTEPQDMSQIESISTITQLLRQEDSEKFSMCIC